MTAAQDYPLGNTHGEVPRWRAMCDEIDQLRAELDGERFAAGLLCETIREQGLTIDDLRTQLGATLTKMQADDMVRHAVGQLVQQLTVHADAMRDVIVTRCQYSESAMRAVQDYDDFIGEA